MIKPFLQTVSVFPSLYGRAVLNPPRGFSLLQAFLPCLPRYHCFAVFAKLSVLPSPRIYIPRNTGKIKPNKPSRNVPSFFRRIKPFYHPSFVRACLFPSGLSILRGFWQDSFPPGFSLPCRHVFLRQGSFCSYSLPSFLQSGLVPIVCLLTTLLVAFRGVIPSGEGFNRLPSGKRVKPFTMRIIFLKFNPVKWLFCAMCLYFSRILVLYTQFS